MPLRYVSKYAKNRVELYLRCNYRLGCVMKLVKSDDFDRYQQELTQQIVTAIRYELEKVDTPDDLVRELTENIAFAVTSLIDDTAGLEINGKSISPILTFLNEREELEFSKGNSWMHEHVREKVKKHFTP